ncbi:MAG: hypothetical protein CMN76_18515 [Spirochaetaceae bacterium]|nr:hypothetical protein [Spirochaetaceae bacterium]|tara:strand:+ start:294024 stop:294482 length:459 start_codon:yes stop_codon:yes gene_type:complete
MGIRKLIFLLTLALGPAALITSLGGAEKEGTLYVHVHGLRNQDGIAGALLFRSHQGFPDTKALAYRMAGARIKGTSATIQFSNLPPGNYALSVIHDENENRRMDKNLISLPKEGFGFSNNPATGMSLPQFEQSRFYVDSDKDTHIHINIRYL